MLVLWKDLQERIRRQVRANGFEGQARFRLTGYPQVHRRDLMTAVDHDVCEIQLPIELERPRLNCQGSRAESLFFSMPLAASICSTNASVPLPGTPTAMDLPWSWFNFESVAGSR